MEYKYNAMALQNYIRQNLLVHNFPKQWTLSSLPKTKLQTQFKAKLQAIDNHDSNPGDLDREG